MLSIVTDLAPAGAWPSGAEIADTLLLRGGYNARMVILGTTLLGVAGGLVGVFALLRKRSLTADALSHATLPGVGLAFLLTSALGFEGRSLLVLLVGAAATGVLGVLSIQFLIRHTRLTEDACVGAVLGVYFGAGVVVLSIVQTLGGGSGGGINAFIFGQSAAMRHTDALLLGVIAGLAIVSALLLSKEFALVSFNDAFAAVDGWPVTRIDLLMMSLIVVVTVAGLQSVGLILVVAMLIIPAVSARFWTDRLWVLLLLAGAIGGIDGYLGASVSALFPRKPTGAVIVLTSGVVFTGCMLLAPSRGVLPAVARRARLRRRVAEDHLLEAAAESAGGEPVVFPESEIRRLGARRGWSRLLRWRVTAGLRAGGFVRPAAGGVELTPEGLARGRRVSRNHKLWEQYLISYADIAPGHIDWSVDQVEHVLSDELVAELEDALRAGPAAPAGGRG